MKQVAFARHFLFKMGCVFNKRDQMYSRNKILTFEAEDGLREWSQDALYHDFATMIESMTLLNNHDECVDCGIAT